MSNAWPYIKLTSPMNDATTAVDETNSCIILTKMKRNKNLKPMCQIKKMKKVKLFI